MPFCLILLFPCIDCFCKCASNKEKGQIHALSIIYFYRSPLNVQPNLYENDPTVSLIIKMWWACKINNIQKGS